MQPIAYNPRTIARILGARLIEGDNPESPVYNLLIDSRKIISARGDLFFALITSRNDGHKYVNDLIRMGVKNFVISGIQDPAWFESKANFIVVENTLHALQKLAAWHRSQFNIPVIGITGSNGKTIIKEWLWQMLDHDLKIVRSPKSYNSQIGVALSVWQINPSHELGIIEAGISMPNEMYKLEPLVSPTLGIFTNIGPAHDVNFQSLFQKAGEKLQLFRNCPELICCADHQPIIEAYEHLKWPQKPKLIMWSKAGRKADLAIVEIQKSTDGTHISALFGQQHLYLTIPFTDDASIDNVITCWLVLLHLGKNQEEITLKMRNLHPVEMRIALKEAVNNCTLIDDSYSCDLASLEIALDFLNQQKQHPKKTLILSDVQQSGLSPQRLYSTLGQLVADKAVDRFIGIGINIEKQRQYFPAASVFFPDTNSFLESLHQIVFENESILVKGARIFSFEKITQALQRKNHETVLEINLDALVHNLNYYRSLLKPGVKLMAMVKAFGYGSGSIEIASVLQYHQVDGLAVAYTDEGVELRKAGITIPVVVMNPESHGYENLFKYGLEPEVYNFRTLQLLVHAIEKYQPAFSDPIKIHLKFDTGMKRLGFEEDDIEKLAGILKSNKHLKVESVFSHLAASDDPSHDDFTLQQIGIFENICWQLGAELGHGFDRHILNSAGISRFRSAQYEMVRLGIGLYGISNLDSELGLLEPVGSLKSIISQIKHVAAGESIGYDRGFFSTKEMKIAVVPIGYADGLSRSLSNGKYSLLVHGKAAPIIGNISMDMCMIDISGIHASEGDEVVIFSPSHSIIDLAKAMRTIPYEVLTSISRRVKRVYYQE